MVEETSLIIGFAPPRTMPSSSMFGILNDAASFITYSMHWYYRSASWETSPFWDVTRLRISRRRRLMRKSPEHCRNVHLFHVEKMLRYLPLGKDNASRCFYLLLRDHFYWHSQTFRGSRFAAFPRICTPPHHYISRLFIVAYHDFLRLGSHALNNYICRLSKCI